MSCGLYIHIPVCKKKCRYCDFYSVACSELPAAGGRIVQEKLLSKIRDEIIGQIDEQQIPEITTVFIGGGTPSVLYPDILNNFLEKLESDLTSILIDDAEFSIEANPESCDRHFLDVLSNHKINRLSLGVQSFSTDMLNIIGRAAYPDDVFGRVEEIRADWNEKLSLDIITGISESSTDFQNKAAVDLNKAMALGPEHLSVYALTLEDGSLLYEDYRKGLYEPPDGNYQADAITEAVGILRDGGYHRYEISNFAAGEGNICRHNMAYWMMESYIGAGPGAVSSIYDDETALRVQNEQNIENYLRTGPEKQVEEIGRFDFMLEHFMMGCRTLRGPDPAVFEKRFGISAEAAIADTLERWRERGLAVQGRCALNDEGLLLSDGFFSDIWEELKSWKKY